jgi:hypothetical protein
MADRYWVGGTAAWDGTAGTKWALTSGGLGGQAVPTSADDVFFDSASGANTVTISTGNTGAKSINCTGFTGTLAGTAAITVSGSVTLVAGMTYSYTGILTINATATLTTAGKSLGSETVVSGSGITVTLGDALTTTKLFTLTQGTFDAANFNVTVAGFSSSNTNTRTVTMGSGTWSISGSWTCTTSTNLTVNANTSTISMTSASPKTFAGGGRTYYILNQGGSGTLVISGANTFNDFTNSVTTANTRIEFTNATTYTFTNFTYSNTAPYTTVFQSLITGATYTLSKSSGTVTVSRLLIRDSIATGGATWNATDSVDRGNNTGWNITASTGRYWVGGTANWDGTAGTKWAASSGAAGGSTVPGLVDPAYFDANSGANTVTISGGNFGCAGIICTGFTGTITGTAPIQVNGNLTLVAGMTYTYTGTMSVNAACTVTCAGKTLGQYIFDSFGQTCTLADACTLGTASSFVLTAGTLNLNGNTLSTGIFSSSGTSTRAITFGSANIALTSTTAATIVLSMATASNFTMTTSGGGFTRNMAATATVEFGTTGGSTSNAPNLTVNAGASALTFTNFSWFKNVDFTGSTSTVSATNLSINGNLTLASGGTYTSIFFSFTSSGTFTSSGRTVGGCAIDGSGITVTLADAATVATSGVFSLTRGTLNLNGNTLSTGRFFSDGTLTRAITFGAANIALTSTTAATTIISMATATGFTFTGTGGFTRNMAATATVQFGSTAGGTTSNAPNLTVNAGASALTISTGSEFRNVDFTGYSGTVSGNYNACGNLTLSTGGTYTSLITTFIASGTLTSVGKTTSNLNISGSGITVTLADAANLGTSGSFTLTQGTLNLNGNTLTTGSISSNNSNTRAITFGSANIALVANVSTTIILMTTATGFTFTGTGGFTRNQVAIATVDFGSSAGGTASNAPNLTVNAGTSALTITNNSYFKNLNFTGFAGSAANNVFVAGNLTLSTGGTYTSIGATFVASGTITSVGKTFFQLAINGSGITVNLADAISVQNGITLTLGTFDAANFNVTTGAFNSNNSNVRTITMGSGTWSMTASSSGAWNCATSTNLTVNANTSTVTMTGASAKTFAGGGRTYYNLNQGGAGALTISGSNTFNNITNTTQPATVTFTAGTTQTVSSFGLTGTAGNLITINSSSAGSQATLSKSSGTISVDYLSIQDSNATGGAAWYAGTNSTNVSNNTGWIFTAPPGPSSGSFLMFLS